MYQPERDGKGASHGVLGQCRFCKPWIRGVGIPLETFENHFSPLHVSYKTHFLQSSSLCIIKKMLWKWLWTFLVPDVGKLSGNYRQVGESTGREERTEKATGIWAGVAMGRPEGWEGGSGQPGMSSPCGGTPCRSQLPLDAPWNMLRCPPNSLLGISWCISLAQPLSNFWWRVFNAAALMTSSLTPEFTLLLVTLIPNQ